MTTETCSMEMHEELKRLAQWEGTYHVGYQRSYAGGEDPSKPDLELRNCNRCHSTLVRAQRAIGDDE